jgi:tRNA wybutosine-synthesizing protein 3
MIEQDKKAEGLFLKVYHDIVDFNKFILDLKEVVETSLGKKLIVKFKQEPAILHIACRDLKSAEVLIRKAQVCGWKRSGMISFGSRFILELLNTERLEFPVVDCGKVLVGDEFLSRCIEKGNENLRKNWEKIERLRKLV